MRRRLPIAAVILVTVLTVSVGAKKDDAQAAGRGQAECANWSERSIPVPTTGSVRHEIVAGNCEVSIEVRRAETSQVSAACAVTATAVSDSSLASYNRGLAVRIAPRGNCEGVTVRVEISVPPAEDAELGTLSDGLWQPFHRIGKTTGQDVINIDMFWSVVRLDWWANGSQVASGSWTHSQGTDPFWDATIGYGLLFPPPPDYLARWQQTWESDGFPYPFMPDVGASTDVLVQGRPNGSSACYYEHSYWGSVWAYPNLHWLDECYY